MRMQRAQWLRDVCSTLAAEAPASQSEQQHARVQPRCWAPAPLGRKPRLWNDGLRSVVSPRLTRVGLNVASPLRKIELLRSRLTFESDLHTVSSLMWGEDP